MQRGENTEERHKEDDKDGLYLQQLQSVGVHVSVMTCQIGVGWERILQLEFSISSIIQAYRVFEGVGGANGKTSSPYLQYWQDRDSQRVDI